MKSLYVVIGNTDVKSNIMCDLLLNKLPSTAFPGCWGEIDPSIETDEIRENVLRSVSLVINECIKSSEYENIIFGWGDRRESVKNELLSRIETSVSDVKIISFNEVEELINKHTI